MNAADAQHLILDALHLRDQKLMRLIGARVGGLDSHIREAQGNFDAAEEQFAYALAFALEAKPSVTADQAQYPGPNLGLTRRSSGDET